MADQPNRPRWVAPARILLGLLPLLLVGIGAWAIYWPAAPLLVGLMIWIDLILWSRE